MTEQNRALHGALWDYDKGWNCLVCGVDEAGRGPLAGPVCAACVCFKEEARQALPDLNDSKKMTPRRRDLAFACLTQGQVAWYGVGWASPQEIDDRNILRATFLAMNRAYDAMVNQMGQSPPPALALVDGNRDPGLPLPARMVVRGDATSASIAAASVIAKVSRDRAMEELDRAYPQYQFSQHKGYPTPLHYRLLGEYGPSPVHRKTFLRTLEKHLHPQREATGGSSALGTLGERYVEHWLVRQGWRILARNWRCPGGEIDLIAQKEGILAFVEVKARGVKSAASPQEAVDLAKQARMRQAAQAYLAACLPDRGMLLQPRFDVAALSLKTTGDIISVSHLDYLENAFEV